MMNQSLKISLISIFFPFILYGQANYMDYYSLINKGDYYFGREQFDSALSMYDSAFKKFEPAFVKDYVIAAQIALISNSNSQVTQYLEQAIKWGYPCDCVEALPIFEAYIKLSDWEKLRSKESEYQKHYASQVSLKLNIEFSIRYRNEQDAKSQKVAYVKEVRSNYKRIKFLIDSIGFPSEHNIGLDDGRIAPNQINKTSGLETCTPANRKVIVTLLHYDNPITDIGIEKFISAIESGLMHPRDFAQIFTFEKYYISRISASREVNKPMLPDYDFNFPFGTMITDEQKVNEDRARFGISSLEIQENVEITQKKYRFNVRTYF